MSNPVGFSSAPHDFEGAAKTAESAFRLAVGAALTAVWGTRLKTSGLAEGHVFLVDLNGMPVTGRIADITASDGSDFGAVVLTPALPATNVEDLEVSVFSHVIGTSQIIDEEEVLDNVVASNVDGKAEILLAGIPNDLGSGSRVTVQNDDQYQVLEIEDVLVKYMTMNGQVTVPQALIKLDGPLPQAWGNAELVVWHTPVLAGKLTRLPKPIVELSDLELGVIAEVTSNVPFDPSGEIVVLRAIDGQLITCEGQLTTEGQITKFTATKILHGEGPLTPPITGYTGLSRVTRGKTVKNEILGSGDASIPFQTFRLKKSPLTYLASPNGPAPQLEVYVNGQQWTRAPSFYGTGPTDQIYTIRHDEDHATIITFGDGELGQRLPTGSNNVVTTYRFGVGGNVPANSITALKKPVKGIRKVFNPLPATGGKDVPPPEELRRNAPLSTLVLGRLVSLPDFEAEARQWGNVVNAKATRGWDESSDQPVVQLWVVTPDAGDPAVELRAYLEGMAEPNIALTVTKATALTRTLRIDLEVDPKRQREVVELAVANHLFHEYDGPLSLRNVSIGGRFHRSKLLAAIQQVPGVVGVGGVTLDGVDLPASLALGTGQYLDCRTSGLQIGWTEAGKQLFGEE